MPSFTEMLVLRSTYRESVVEHLFLGQLLPLYWRVNPSRPIEVSKPTVDDAGYDLILEVPGIVRHVQLKSSLQTSKTRQQNVHERLAEKPSGCVVWITHDDDFKIGPFRWFGKNPGVPLPCLSGFKHAKATRANAQGERPIRPSLYEVPKSAFEEMDRIEDLCRRLFGNPRCAPAVDTSASESPLR